MWADPGLRGQIRCEGRLRRPVRRWFGAWRSAGFASAPGGVVTSNQELFYSSYDALGAYRQKLISLDSPLWLRWKLDQRAIGSREVPIEVQYESLGTYHEIYAHYLIVGNRKKEICSIYIRTTLGHISFYREIEEAVQGFSQAYSYTI